jgi:hypothetical protein
MDSLLPEDHEQISEMVGNVFDVEEIDEAGQAWVTMWWDSMMEMRTELAWLRPRWNSLWTTERQIPSQRPVDRPSLCLHGRAGMQEPF